ncbi:16S rRNA processing protein RimM [Meinhardsimonia xiamenensis]|jgi:16S rRNA processing protein RimM|uniref:Ribosome maturation factor RimM n=1 Tax=Meinhardsimonia xiamenensis TaxID=990712 RepID=A0A1G9EFZ9_9RHOB|nr:ribosome maturation factor RimM [Meinhardsimonia xiamenensis]PRX33786.1 16S rRNA processing protein RimM [Meinhardsimonia xiamenensis]SDK75018.1 16S rRNA processing protein RimM [Meinhardsimonia xiamenensis]
MPQDRTRPARVCLGAIAGAFGVRGEVRLKSFCSEPEAIAAYGPLWSEDGTRCFEIRLERPIKGGFAARLSGVQTREEAEALRGMRLYADRDALPPTGEEEYYHADLIGLEVRDTGGQLLGRVAAVLDHGAGDLLEVRGPGLGAGVLVPFTRDVVPTVDLEAGRIVVDPPAGLFPDSSGSGEGGSGA